MLNALIIGNLGADAETKVVNDYQFVTFRVAHTRKFTNPTTGETTERTLWVSCTMRGDGGKVLQYLKKGTKVYIYADDLEPTLYVSSKDGQQHAGLNCRVRQIELCGSNAQQQQQQQLTAESVRQYLSMAPTGILEKIGVRRPAPLATYTGSSTAQAQEGAQDNTEESNLAF